MTTISVQPNINLCGMNNDDTCLTMNRTVVKFELSKEMMVLRDTDGVDFKCDIRPQTRIVTTSLRLRHKHKHRQYSACGISEYTYLGICLHLYITAKWREV